jgi:hypothetical protein
MLLFRAQRTGSVAIDDPKAVFEEQYQLKEKRSPLGLSLFAFKLAFPKAAPLLGIFQTIASRFTPRF